MRSTSVNALNARCAEQPFTIEVYDPKPFDTFNVVPLREAETSSDVRAPSSSSCRSCGNAISEGMKFCVECGASVAKSPASVEARKSAGKSGSAGGGLPMFREDNSPAFKLIMACFMVLAVLYGLHETWSRDYGLIP